MAAPPPSPDTPITLKVAFDGASRRFKLPLRDLTASSLETKVRHYLIIKDTPRQSFHPLLSNTGHIH